MRMKPQRYLRRSRGVSNAVTPTAVIGPRRSSFAPSFRGAVPRLAGSSKPRSSCTRPRGSAPNEGSSPQGGHHSLEHYAPLILAFTDSVSYRDDSMSILHLLEHSLRRLPGITCVVCEKFLERFSDEARDVRTSRMGDAHTVTQLVFRTYHQHQQDEWTGRALDLIDRLCLEGIGDARQELDAFER